MGIYKGTQTLEMSEWSRVVIKSSVLTNVFGVSEDGEILEILYAGAMGTIFITSTKYKYLKVEVPKSTMCNQRS